MEIRVLKPDEIECRVKQVKEHGCMLLLYKDARCDMKILDETFGVTGWEREHTVINGNLFCTVRVWDKEKGMWVSKQDVGIESNTEKEKGQASDAFKRACFNIGIGRELYSSPFIWIKLKDGETYSKNGKFYLNPSVKFSPYHIETDENKNIIQLGISDQNDTKRFKWAKKQ